MASCSTRHPGRENADSPSVAAIFSFLIGTSALTGLSLEQRACSRTGADHQVSGSTQALERWPGGRRWGLGLPVTGGVLQGPPCPPSSGHTPGPGGLTVTPPRAPPQTSTHPPQPPGLWQVLQPERPSADDSAFQRAARSPQRSAPLRPDQPHLLPALRSGWVPAQVQGQPSSALDHALSLVLLHRPGLSLHLLPWTFLLSDGLLPLLSLHAYSGLHQPEKENFP